MLCISYPCNHIGWCYRQRMLRLFCVFMRLHYYLIFSHISYVHISTFITHFITFVEEHTDFLLSYETASVYLPWLIQKYHAKSTSYIHIEIDPSGDMFHIRRK